MFEWFFGSISEVQEDDIVISQIDNQFSHLRHGLSVVENGTYLLLDKKAKLRLSLPLTVTC